MLIPRSGIKIPPHYGTQIKESDKEYQHPTRFPIKNKLSLKNDLTRNPWQLPSSPPGRQVALLQVKTSVISLSLFSEEVLIIALHNSYI